ncbi:MAG: hypothetical protein IT204_20720 [Fimbriimonadaceae bacterium]|nr:hypothetical protein [Fimbriimonadaceae bacterium]
MAAPVELSDPIALADWVEMLALQPRRLPANLGDVDQVLRQAAGGYEDEGIDNRVDQVAAELEKRSVAAGPQAYPFDFDGDLLRRRDPVDAHVPYAFCACLSFAVGQGWNSAGLDGLVRDTHPRRDFERLCRAAAVAYLGAGPAAALRFGSPRDDLPAPFGQALAEVVRQLREGGACREEAYGASPGTGDEGLDIIAWRPFYDTQRSKLVMFGQCATGRGWQDKLTELSPSAFCQNWLSDYREPWPVKGLFVPHRLTDRQWLLHPTHAGIVFDRCRIAALEPVLDGRLRGRLVRWTNALLARLAP